MQRCTTRPRHLLPRLAYRILNAGETGATRTAHRFHSRFFRTNVAQGPESKIRQNTIRNYAVAFSFSLTGLAMCGSPLYRLFCAATGTGTNPSDILAGEKAPQTLTDVVLGLVASAADFYMSLPCIILHGKEAALNASLASSSYAVDEQSGQLTPSQALLRPLSLSRTTPLKDADPITVRFMASNSAKLPWSFEPLTKSVTVIPGETALAFFRARNNHPTEDVVGIASYNILPPEAAAHFQKIQCFCFEEQRLLPGESVDMPVFFYIDPEFAQDPATYLIDHVTLSYTFFKSSAA